MTDQQHLLKHGFDGLGVLANKAGQRGEVRDRIAGQGLEQNIGLAAPLDLAAGGNAFGVGEQNDLQQDGRIVGQAACSVISTARVKYRQIQLVFNQVMNGVLERAWLELLLVVDHHHAVLAVVVGLEAWHATLLVGLPKCYQIRGFSTASTPQTPAERSEVRVFWIVMSHFGISILNRPIACFFTLSFFAKYVAFGFVRV